MNTRKMYTVAIAALAIGAAGCGPSITADRDASVPIPTGATYAPSLGEMNMTVYQWPGP